VTGRTKTAAIIAPSITNSPCAKFTTCVQLWMIVEADGCQRVDAARSDPTAGTGRIACNGHVLSCRRGRGGCAPRPREPSVYLTGVHLPF